MTRDSILTTLIYADGSMTLKADGTMTLKVVIVNLVPISGTYRGADKSLVRPGRKQATATEDFDLHISYLLS